LRVIASCGNSAKKSDFSENLPKFYIKVLNEDDFETLYSELARLEEEGIIIENNGNYSVTESHLPNEHVKHKSNYP
jgi:hypothetical protein